MKRLAIFLMVAAMPAAFAQDPAAVPATNAPLAADSGQETLKVEDTIKQLEKKRAKEKALLEEQLLEAERKVAELEAARKGLEEEVPRREQEIERAKLKKEESYQLLAKVSDECDQAVSAARLKYQEEEIAKLQARFDEEYRIQKEKHDRDIAFIQTNKWHASDLADLELAMDPVDLDKTLLFRGGEGNSVTGMFPTVDFELGTTTWHATPPTAKFSPVVQRNNPFLIDLFIHPGSDVTASGSTNVFDWDMHVYVEKDFRNRDPHYVPREKGLPQDYIPTGRIYRVVGVSWPVDLGRPLCRMYSEPYKFEPIPMPVHTNVDANTDPIPTLVSNWVPRGELEALIAKKEDQRQATKTASQYLETLIRSLPLLQEKIARKLKDNDERMKIAMAEVDDLKSRLDEYKIDYEDALRQAEEEKAASEGEAAGEGEGGAEGGEGGGEGGGGAEGGGNLEEGLQGGG